VRTMSDLTKENGCIHFTRGGTQLAVANFACCVWCENDRMRAEIAALKQKCARLERDNNILQLKCSGSLANNLCPDHRDKQTGKPCLACEIERLSKSRETGAALTDVWMASSKTTSAIFASLKEAEAFVASMPASIGGGFHISCWPIFGTTHEADDRKLCDGCGIDKHHCEWSKARGSLKCCPDCSHAAPPPTPIEAKPEVPKGHFWRGEFDRFRCRNCGRPHSEHLHTDEASTCPRNTSVDNEGRKL
jgi:hypothetical protein